MISTINTSHGSVTIRPTREEDVAAYRELRLEALEDEMDNLRSTLAVLLDRLERRFGPEGEKVTRP